MDRKIKIILVAAIIFGVAAYIFQLWPRKEINDDQATGRPENKINDQLPGTESSQKDTDAEEETVNEMQFGETSVTVDTTEDVKGLGYPGQRKLAEDGKGNIFITYRKKHQGYNQIFVARAHFESGRWNISGTEEPISSVGEKVDQRVPSIAIDQSGVIHVVWYGAESKKEQSNRQIKYSNSRDGGASWSKWKNISYVDGYDGKEDYWQEHPLILAGKKNTLYVVWEGKDKENDKQQIKISKSSDGGASWSKWKNISISEGRTQSRPVILEDSQGALHVLMYSSVGGEEQQIQYSHYSDVGKTWSEWQSVSNSLMDSRHLSAAIDSNDSIHVAWREALSNEEGPTQIIYSSLGTSGTWSNPQVVAPSGSFQFFPGIAINKDGLPLIAWMETQNKSDFPREDPETGEVRFAQMDPKDPNKFIVRDRQENGLYPNLPDTFRNDKYSPAVFEKKEKEDFSIVLYFIKDNN